MSDPLTVTIAIPVLNEELHLQACLDAVAAQSYPDILEILVIDGGSTDGTRAIAAADPLVRLLDNPRRIQAAALNVALEEARGDVFVRVDGHCIIADDYVERCVDDLGRADTAMVGGGMTPIAEGPIAEAIAAAMASPIGAGPARFHSSTVAGWADTVYLGAYRTDDARSIGGYAEDVGVNEDSEFAIRMAHRGGIWFDPAIRSTYTPRADIASVARQFYRYGRGRARTVRRHPSSLSPRQLVAPALVIGLLSPWRRVVLAAYAVVVGGWTASGLRRGRPLAAGLVLPAMHIPWGVGFLLGLFRDVPGPTRPSAVEQPARDARTDA